MRLLLDTHVAVWAISNPKRLPASIQALFLDAENEIFVSVINVWEIAIKAPLRRRDTPAITAANAIKEFESAGYGMVQITAQHALRVESLPLIHGDPFDRLLIAQALSEPMRLITRDTKVAAYSDTIISW